MMNVRRQAERRTSRITPKNQNSVRAHPLSCQTMSPDEKMTRSPGDASSQYNLQSNLQSQTPQGQSPFQASQLATLESVAIASRYSHPEDSRHNERVGYLAALIAEQLELPERETELLRYAAPLHDIGTLFLPEKILHKPGRLSPEEFEVVKTHVSIGVSMLQRSENELFKMAQVIVETHHERFDGSGYPYGNKGVNIPLIGQITAVADVFDTLVHDRPYRPAWSIIQAAEEIKNQAGAKFDPQVVGAFLEVAAQQDWGRERPKPKVLIRGKLGTLTLFDLIGSLAQNGQNCKLCLYTGFASSVLHFFGGRLVHAEAANKVGQAALTHLVQKAEGRTGVKFIVEAWNVDSLKGQTVSLHAPTDHLLMKAAVVLDEQGREKSTSQL